MTLDFHLHGMPWERIVEEAKKLGYELQEILDAGPAEIPVVSEDHAQAEAVSEIDQKIDRLVNTLAESSDVAVVYI